jgi:hypothetical protein
MANSSSNAPVEKIEYVLFMSPECKFCVNFMNKLRTKPELVKKFNIVNIDNIEVLPDEVDEIPCVYDGKSIAQGAQSFKWLEEKLSDFLDAANDGLPYAFLDGQDERVFGMYSLLDQKNGSHGIGNSPLGQGQTQQATDPTRMIELNDNTNKNRTIDSLMASRTNDLQNILQK